MARIRVLDEVTANQIAAGEVVERPASVIKELIENAIDAGATRVAVTIAHGGKTLIRVEDDGHGMAREDVPLAFDRHATSKLSNASDLLRLVTLGFRGEALPSIASVARVTLTTLARGESEGTRIEIHGGKRIALEPAAAAPGTVIEVRDLFFNVPARLKFLRSTGAETAAATGVFLRQALAHPELYFSFASGGRAEWVLPRAASRRERAAQLLGAERAGRWIEASRAGAGARLEALLEPPDSHHPTRGEQHLFVNRRPVVDRGLQHALLRAYEGLLPPSRFPAAVLFLELDEGLVDVNVHPAKSEVRFADPAAIQSLIAHGLREALAGGGFVPELRADPYAERVRNAVEGFLAGHTGAAGGGVAEGGGPRQYLLRPAGAGGGLSFEPRPKPGAELGPESGFEPERGPESRAAGERCVADAGEAAGEPLEPGRVRVLGQVGSTFVVAEDARGMVLFDQHTAHERVLYEGLEKDDAGALAVQPLLVPQVVELAPAEAAVLAGIRDELAGAGIDLEPMGANAFAVRSLPAAIPPAAALRLVRACVSEASEGRERESAARARERVLATLACHAAVKRNMRLELPAMERLVQDLLRCRDPFRCPHGRAVLLRYDHETIERSFGRYW